MIDSLQPNQVFVFGSNLAGKHGGGAALQAYMQFGAVYGVGEGLTGHAYAFPTLGYSFEKLNKIELEASRDVLYGTAEALPAVTFLLTKVGCGIAGYPEEDMKLLFEDAPENIIKPEGWSTYQW